MNTNHYTYEMYTKGKDGKEFKTLEITYQADIKCLLQTCRSRVIHTSI